MTKKLKIPGGNFTRKVLSKPQIKLIKEWKYFVGDTVVLTQGKETGKQGKILSIVKDKNAVVVENCNTVNICFLFLFFICFL